MRKELESANKIVKESYMNVFADGNGYQPTQEELREIQLTQLELIHEVKRICQKYNIHYSMVGGTMLGAIRHHGYIPWDDDADIGFLRKEYEKFRIVCRTELDTRKYYFQDCRDTAGYRWGYGKLRRKNTEFIRLDQEFMPYEQGIAIDIMPFDNVPDSLFARKVYTLICFFYRKTFWSVVGRKTERNFFKKKIYELLYLIPERRLIKSYQKWIDRCIKLGRTKQVRILTFPTPKGVYGYDRRWYTNLRPYKFEDCCLPGAKDYDGYLKVKYDNYMNIPPLANRKAHPISRLRLLNRE